MFALAIVLTTKLPPARMSRRPAWLRKGKGVCLPLPRAELLHRHAPALCEQLMLLMMRWSAPRGIVRGAHFVLPHSTRLASIRLRLASIFSTVELATWPLPLKNVLLLVHFTRRA